jgi:hypothetical protein
MKKRNHDRVLETPGTARTGRLGYGQESLMSFKKKKVKNGFIYITESKTDERREIPVNDDVATMFKEIRREQGLSSPCVSIRETSALSTVLR